jgi:hypothetical protein
MHPVVRGFFAFSFLTGSCDDVGRLVAETLPPLVDEGDQPLNEAKTAWWVRGDWRSCIRFLGNGEALFGFFLPRKRSLSVREGRDPFRVGAWVGGGVPGWRVSRDPGLEGGTPLVFVFWGAGSQGGAFRTTLGWRAEHLWCSFFGGAGSQGGAFRATLGWRAEHLWCSISLTSRS